MKKLNLLLKVFITILITWSCERAEHQINHRSLETDLLSIEIQVLSFDYSDLPSMEIINNHEFFSVFDMFRKSISIEENEKAYRQLTNQESKSDKESINQIEKKILKSFATSISGKPFQDILYISDIYICEIENLNISNSSKQKAVKLIKDYRDLKVYLNSWQENKEYSNLESKDKDDYNCRFHPCIECCIIEELEAIEDNVVKIVAFMINIGTNTAVLGLSCVWACAT